MFSFKLAINDVTGGQHIDWREHDAWRDKPLMRAKLIKVRAYIYQCKDLAAADSDGTSDPYVQVWDLSKNDLKTKVIDDNTNPLFYEVLEMNYEVRDINDISTYPPFIFDVYDKNQIKSDIYLSRAIIQAKDCVMVFPQRLECPLHQQKMCLECQSWR